MYQRNRGARRDVKITRSNPALTLTGPAVVRTGGSELVRWLGPLALGVKKSARRRAERWCEPRPERVRDDRGAIVKFRRAGEVGYRDVSERHVRARRRARGAMDEAPADAAARVR